MVDYREILRLRSLGNNITQIANAIHSSRHTVRDIEKLPDEKGICWPLGEELTNQKLYSLLYPERLEKAQVYMEPDCAYIHCELAKKGVNLTLLWNEYKAMYIPLTLHHVHGVLGFFRKFTFFQKSYSGSVDIYWLYTITFFDIRDFAEEPPSPEWRYPPNRIRGTCASGMAV